MASTSRPSPLPIRPSGPGSPGLLPDLPPVSALFLIDFDVKAGYTIVWKRSVPGIDLEGVVEYKSLPSGLHTVSEDLIYFVHEGGYAGLSAFVNARTDEEESRHARMIAVGVLVPFSHGRLGRAWRHARGLKDMASKLALDRTDTDILGQYWENHGARPPVSSPQPSEDAPPRSPSISFTPARPLLAQKGHSRNRSDSEAVPPIPSSGRLSPFHPAWSLTSLLDTFGPLLFPIHRAALLRKRILISTHAPVHEACNFVYNISVLSNIPSHVLGLLDPLAESQRLKPLFTVGVHDIPSLLEYQAASRSAQHADDASGPAEAGAGWIACTTDSILAMKGDLWDMLITIPPAYSAQAKEKVWPTVECPKGVPVKATQRDLRRLGALRVGLGRVTTAATTTAARSSSPTSTQTTNTTAVEDPGIRLHSAASRPATGASRESFAAAADDDADAIVEPPTWAALAYAGFMWWASAGEQRRAEEAEEQARDASLLAELGAPSQHHPAITAPNAGSPRSPPPGAAGLGESWSSLTAARRSTGGEGDQSGEDDREPAAAELALIAYFHRLTTQMLSVLADTVETTDDDDDIAAGGDEEEDEQDNGDDNDQTRLVSGGVGSERDEAEIVGSVRVDSEVLAHMGLDVWSQADAEFARELTSRYFLRRAYVEGKGVEVCGLRVC